MNNDLIHRRMDREKWFKLIQELTAGDGELATRNTLDGDNHLAIAYKFFMKQNIDTEGKQFLDAGCGDNRLSTEIKSIWHGADLNPFTVPSEHFHYYDLHATEYKNQFFDIIFCSHTLEHVLSPLIVLNEFKRILKDDGRMIIALPLYPGFITDQHNYMMPSGSWKHLFKQVGLKVLDEHLEHDTGNYYLKKEE